MHLPFITAEEIDRLLGPAEAVESIARALRTEVDPEADAPRVFSPLANGEFLLMPASSGQAVGIKVVTVAPGNPGIGSPRIQALYVLYDARTLTPRYLLDGSSLTLIRTPATTAFAVRALLAHDPRGARGAIERLALFGTGPQAFEHIRVIGSVVPIERVEVRGRDAEKSRAFAVRVREELGLPADELDEEGLRRADVVVCATSTTRPLFDGGLLAADAVVAAVGTHGLEAREIGPELLERADVVVEARAAALREYGNLIPARDAEYWRRQRLTNLRDLARGELQRRSGRVALYTGVGMSWQDLVIVEEIVARYERAAVTVRGC